jgi:C1A family cysteine protease
MNRGTKEQLSHLWVYGNRSSTQLQTEGMNYLEALNNLNNDGIVPYHDLPNNSTSDGYGYFYNAFYVTRASGTLPTAKETVQASYNQLLPYAQGYQINGYVNNFNTWDSELMKKYITENYAVILPIHLNSGFDVNVGSDGIVPDSGTPYYNNGEPVGHSVVAVGWKIINSKLHWICVNSWGKWFRDGGLVYVPHLYQFAYTGFSPYPSINTPI